MNLDSTFPNSAPTSKSAESNGRFQCVRCVLEKIVYREMNYRSIARQIVWPICHSVCVSVCLSVCLSVCMCMCMHVCVCVYACLCQSLPPTPTILAKIHVDTARAFVTVVTSFTYKQEKAPPHPPPPSPCWLMQKYSLSVNID